jgi:hypothetical protein
MSITRSITVVCDECFAMESSNSPIAVHLGSVWAGGLGWSYDTLGHNWCPSCTAKRKAGGRRKRDLV